MAYDCPKSRKERTFRLILFKNLFKPRQRRLAVYVLLTSSVLSTTSKRCFEQPVASFLRALQFSLSFGNLLLVFSKENISYVLGRDFILGSSKRNEDSHMTMTIKVNYQKNFQEVVKADKLATK